MESLLRELQSESFVLSLTEPLSVDLPELNGINFLQRAPREIEAEVVKPNTISDLFAGLQSAGITVEALRNKANRLEELFLRITSQKGETDHE